MSTTLLWLLFFEFVFLFVVAGIERNQGLAFYWFGASIIQIGLIVGMK